MSIEFSQELDTAPIISPRQMATDGAEVGLRPKLLSDYTGQEKAKANLSVYLEAARRRNEPLDHTLLYGPPGLGKTTLAGIIANEMGVGKKIAQRIILELKDKVGGSNMELDFSGIKPAAAPVAANTTALASAALQELGYSAAEVAAALKGVDPKATTEEMVRYGLRQMVMKG